MGTVFRHGEFDDFEIAIGDVRRRQRSKKIVKYRRFFNKKVVCKKVEWPKP